MPTLARELREKVYEHALMSNSPIVVWAGGWQADAPMLPKEQDWRWRPGKRPGEPGCPVKCWRAVDRQATKQSIQQTAFNLLQSNRMLAGEAAAVFYRKNTFSFLGDHNWEPIVAWLRAIGRLNRGYLRNIEVEVIRPDRVWQHSDGRRVRCLYTKEEVYPRNRWLKFEPPDQEGIVDNINPAIEEVFALLLDRELIDKAPLTLTFNVVEGIVPGIDYGFDHEDPGITPIPMDLPNLAALFRIFYGQASMDVLWKGEDEKDSFDCHVDEISPTEWEILDASIYDRTTTSPAYPRKPFHEQCVRWKLRRKLSTASSNNVAVAPKSKPAVPQPDHNPDFVFTDAALQTRVPTQQIYASRPLIDHCLRGPNGPMEWVMEWCPEELLTLEPMKYSDYKFLSVHPMLQGIKEG
ncbi:MAG: hypothetical protein M1822_009644 [Bathelium mastoideum]|nr:MAG: hypothetical protein M1822_009644 [Bathelium mastoideum]